MSGGIWISIAFMLIGLGVGLAAACWPSKRIPSKPVRPWWGQGQ